MCNWVLRRCGFRENERARSVNIMHAAMAERASVLLTVSVRALRSLHREPCERRHTQVRGLCCASVCVHAFAYKYANTCVSAKLISGLKPEIVDSIYTITPHIHDMCIHVQM